ncbi:hypothetical protein [Streptomyces sp. NPDC001165]
MVRTFAPVLGGNGGLTNGIRLKLADQGTQVTAFTWASPTPT